MFNGLWACVLYIYVMVSCCCAVRYGVVWFVRCGIGARFEIVLYLGIENGVGDWCDVWTPPSPTPHQFSKNKNYQKNPKTKSNFAGIKL